jgi:aminoglycoside phosphotransferase (APT) family kinase protein
MPRCTGGWNRLGDGMTTASALGWETLATLHRVAPATPAADLTNRYGLHPLSEWRRWARGAEAAELPWADDAHARLALVAELRPLLTDAVQRWQHTARLVHSDISPANVLIAPRGAVREVR